jgi:hypothetical protein
MAGIESAPSTSPFPHERQIRSGSEFCTPSTHIWEACSVLTQAADEGTLISKASVRDAAFRPFAARESHSAMFLDACETPPGAWNIPRRCWRYSGPLPDRGPQAILDLRKHCPSRCCVATSKNSRSLFCLRSESAILHVLIAGAATDRNPAMWGWIATLRQN